MSQRSSKEQAIAQLEQQAAQAPVKAQCYLYAELVHDLVEYSAQEYAAGNVEKAEGMLKRSQEFARIIEAHLEGDTKKLKEAQILLRRSAYRLADLLHAGSSDDGPLVEETLTQLNQAQTDLMMRVFRR